MAFGKDDVMLICCPPLGIVQYVQPWTIRLMSLGINFHTFLVSKPIETFRQWAECVKSLGGRPLILFILPTLPASLHDSMQYIAKLADDVPDAYILLVQQTNELGDSTKIAGLFRSDQSDEELLAAMSSATER